LETNSDSKEVLQISTDLKCGQRIQDQSKPITNRNLITQPPPPSHHSANNHHRNQIPATPNLNTAITTSTTPVQ
jgi:hypothetical protein